MGHKTTLLREAAWHAWHGSIDLANAWAPIVGAAAMWAVLTLAGKKFGMPDTIEGTIGFGLMCLGSSWLVIFIARLLYYPFHIVAQHREEMISLNKAAMNSKRKRQIRDVLGGFAYQCVLLMNACNDESKPIPTAEMDALQKKIQDYMAKELELSYLGRFRSPIGGPVLPPDLSEHQKAKAGWKFRNERLNEFIKEFAD